MLLYKVLSVFLESLCLFLPILAANQAPGPAHRHEWPLGRMPVSRRWLGENKTLAAYWACPLFSVAVTSFVYQRPDWWPEGLVMGLGVALGDHIKSFVKRRLGKPPGSPWWPDRIDFAVGGGVAMLLYSTWVGIEHVIMLAFIAWPVHYFGNKWSYERGRRNTPH